MIFLKCWLVSSDNYSEGLYGMSSASVLPIIENYTRKPFMTFLKDSSSRKWQP